MAFSFFHVLIPYTKHSIMEPLGTNIHMMIIVIVIRSRINIFMISLTVTVTECCGGARFPAVPPASLNENFQG